MCTSTIALILLTASQILAGGFEWSLRPLVQYGCVGSDKVLHWKYKTATAVNMVLLQNLRSTLTLVECHVTAKDDCLVYDRFHDRVKVVEMVQGSAQYKFFNLTTSDNAVYMLQLLGPGVIDNATLFVFSGDDLAATYFVNNEPVKANSSYVCTEQCDSMPILVKTHNNLRANISFFDASDNNRLLLVCTDQATCVYTHTQGSGTARIKVSVNYGFCNELTSYVDISISGAGWHVVPIIVVTVVLVILLLTAFTLYKLKKLLCIHKLFQTSSSKSSGKSLLQKTHCSAVQCDDLERAVAEDDFSKSEHIFPAQKTVKTDVSPNMSHQKLNSRTTNENCDNGMKNVDPVQTSVSVPTSSQNRLEDEFDCIIQHLQNIKLQSPSTIIMPSQKQEIIKPSVKSNFTEYRDNKHESDTSDDEQDSKGSGLSLSNGSQLLSPQLVIDEDVVMRESVSSDESL